MTSHIPLFTRESEVQRSTGAAKARRAGPPGAPRAGTRCSPSHTGRSATGNDQCPVHGHGRRAAVLRRVLGTRTGRPPPHGHLGDGGAADLVRPRLRLLRARRGTRGRIGGPPRRPAPQQHLHPDGGHRGPRLPLPAQSGPGPGRPADPTARHRARGLRHRHDRLLRGRTTHRPQPGVVRVLRAHLHLLPGVHGQGLPAADLGPLPALDPAQSALGPAHDLGRLRLRPPLRRVQALRPDLHRPRSGAHSRPRPVLKPVDPVPLRVQRDRARRRRTPHHRRTHPARPAVAAQPTAPPPLGT